MASNVDFMLNSSDSDLVFSNESDSTKPSEDEVAKTSLPPEVGGSGHRSSIDSARQATRSLTLSTSSYIGKQRVLPWDKFSYWVNAILVVTFDIELGQSLESIYPSASQVKLSANEKSNICYMSFPDSNSGFLGDTQYHFRIKQDPPANSSVIHTPLSQVNNNSNNTSASATAKKHFTSNTSTLFNNSTNYDEYNRKTLCGLEVDKNYIFGYVYFRQVKDKTLKRGYFQKSVVLLSKFPYVSLFNYILGLIAVEYFNTGAEVLETACHDIDKWPLPVPGEVMSLPILGHLIEVCLPVKIEKYSLPVIYKKDLPSVPVCMPPVHEVNLYKCLQPILLHIHLIWELVLLNEPIVVIATVPNACSETVQSLISTIWPLKYASDYRPFFTIHNSEFPEFSAKNSSPPALVVGVTNPFFTKCLQHWPTIIKISDTSKALDTLGKPGSNGQMPSTPPSSAAFSPKSIKIKKTSNLRVVDTKPAVYTRHQPFLNKDKETLKNLIRGAESNRPSEAQSAILRRYFIELTQSFMIPLERYFSSLMPLHKSISPFKSVPKLKDFDADEFLRNLKQAGPELAPTLKGEWQGLYRRFLDSLNFKHWYLQKRIEAEKKLELLQIQVLCDYDVAKWIQGKHEIEIIDQYMNIKKKLDLVENDQIEVSEPEKLKIKSIISTFLNALPEDVRSILNK